MTIIEVLRDRIKYLEDRISSNNNGNNFVEKEISKYREQQDYNNSDSAKCTLEIEILKEHLKSLE